MEHFVSEDWVDFARRVGNQEKRKVMEEHLNSGCQECRATLSFWEETQQSAAREALYAPPDHLLRAVKGWGALRLSSPTRSRFATLADLIMDSSRAAATAGVRSGEMAPWLLLYKAGSVNIDLRVDQIPSSNRVSIVGQVLDLSALNQMIAGAPVAAIVEGSEAQNTVTNEFGEFQLEMEARPQVCLAVQVTNEREIWVPLDSSKREHSQGTWSPLGGNPADA
jgi:hypothetical protein